MKMNIDLEQLKTFSVLSETPQFVDAGPGQRYVSYLGYIFTYNTFSTLFMWCLSGPHIYQGIWAENNSINLLKSLNLHDEVLSSMREDHIALYFVSKISEKLKDLDPSDMEKLLNYMFENAHH